jgi:chromosome segregation ATPase
VKRYILGMLERMGYATARDKALGIELARVKDQLGVATTRINDLQTQLNLKRQSLEAQIASKDAELADAKAQLARCMSERDLAAKHTDRTSLRVEALKRRRSRLQEELRKSQDQLARADVSGRIRDLEEEKARLQQRLADLHAYFEENERSGNSYRP